MKLKPKEGLALINGEVSIHNERLAIQADVVAALSLEVLKLTSCTYYPSIHLATAHDGKLFSAIILRNSLHNPTEGKDFISEIAIAHRYCGKVQDACTLRFVRKIFTTEINSGTDNPMIFAENEKRYNIILWRVFSNWFIGIREYE